MIPEKAREVLETFNEKVEELEHSRFYRCDSYSINVHVFGPEPDTYTLDGIDREDVKSFAVTARLFFQGNDEASIANLEEAYRVLGASAGLVEELGIRTGQLRVLMDGYTGFTINDTAGTYEGAFKLFIYGDIAHTTKRSRFKRETGNALRRLMWEAPFLDVLHALVPLLGALRDLNLRVLQGTRVAQ